MAQAVSPTQSPLHYDQIYGEGLTDEREYDIEHGESGDGFPEDDQLFQMEE